MSSYNIGKDVAAIEMRLRRLEELVYGSEQDKSGEESTAKDVEGDKEAAD